MIIDSHAHFWKAAAKPAQPNIGAYHDPISYDELIQTMDEVGIDKLIQLTHGTSGFNNDYSLEGAARYPDRIRVMGRLDARAPDVFQQLENWLSNPLMVGIRMMTAPSQLEAPWWSDGTLERLWPEIQRHRIPVTIGAPDQMKMLDGIAERFPDMVMIVDHVGLRVFDIFESKPSMQDWPNLLALKRHKNVYIKVSALPEAMVESAPFVQSRQRLREVYDTFGPDRMIWGSNYPRVTQVCSYRESLDVIREASFLSETDKEKILHKTISKVLSLPW